jgi:hypothetical protein
VRRGRDEERGEARRGERRGGGEVRRGEREAKRGVEGKYL